MTRIGTRGLRLGNLPARIEFKPGDLWGVHLRQRGHLVDAWVTVIPMVSLHVWYLRKHHPKLVELRRLSWYLRRKDYRRLRSDLRPIERRLRARIARAQGRLPLRGLWDLRAQRLDREAVPAQPAKGGLDSRSVP